MSQIKVTVKNVAGRVYTLNANENDKIEKLKKMLEEKDAIPPSQQKMVFAGKQLPDDKTLKELGIDSNTVIQLDLALKGGRGF